MSTELLCVITLCVFLPSLFYWLWQIRKRTYRLRYPLMSVFALFCISLISTALLLVIVTTMQSYRGNMASETLSIGILFLFPSLYLILKTAIHAKALSRSDYLWSLTPSLLYSSFGGFLTLSVSQETIMTTPWMTAYVTIVYNYLLFCNVLIAIVFFVYRYNEYCIHTCNYYSDLTVSDHKCVKGIGVTCVITAILTYFVLALRLNTFNGKWALTVPFLLSMLFIVHYLGYHLSEYKGAGVPESVDWEKQTLTLEEIEAKELCYQQADKAVSIQYATMNIGETIERWAESPKKPYLRSGITLAEVAEETKIPAVILSNFLNKSLDTNFNQWINSYRIKHVKYLLLTSNQNLDDIAEVCGFSNRSLMSRTFKALEGISPSDFRKQKE